MILTKVSVFFAGEYLAGLADLAGWLSFGLLDSWMAYWMATVPAGRLEGVGQTATTVRGTSSPPKPCEVWPPQAYKEVPKLIPKRPMVTKMDFGTLFHRNVEKKSTKKIPSRISGK